MSVDPGSDPSDDEAATGSAQYRALSLVQSLAATTPPENTCGGKGCDDEPSVAVRTAHKPPTAYCDDCAERELGRYQTAREYPLSSVRPPEQATTFEPVEESRHGVAYELSPPADEPEFAEMWLVARNITTNGHRERTVIDLEDAV